MNTVYAFCRMTDDIVDDEGSSKIVKKEKLHKWRNDFEKALNGNSENELFIELITCIQKYSNEISIFDTYFDCFTIC